jgi:GT2 family glycosyltransferase
MPIATKRKVEAKKSAPILEAEPEPKPLEEEQAPAPKVTALVFSYDSAPALRRCLAALEGSNDRALIEILVVDCGSHDESPQLDTEFPEITILRLPRYFGRTKALNIATRTAAGEYLFFLTPEVEVLPTTIPSLLAKIESEPEVMAVCPLLIDT